MQPESPAQKQKVILLPPTHEQSNPSFHVDSTLESDFLGFLTSHGVVVAQPPAKLPKQGPDSQEITEVRAEADTPIQKLESLLKEFLAEKG